jgi:bifunctional DNA-binding transcriptional regulator/antitoxin component of YhaV-PrlF toxin-antitoxin module
MDCCFYLSGTSIIPASFRKALAISEGDYLILRLKEDRLELLTHKSVLDASALLALLNHEAGADQVAAVISRAALSAVNLAEVVAKLIKDLYSTSYF